MNERKDNLNEDILESLDTNESVSMEDVLTGTDKAGVAQIAETEILREVTATYNAMGKYLNGHAIPTNPEQSKQPQPEIE